MQTYLDILQALKDGRAPSQKTAWEARSASTAAAVNLTGRKAAWAWKIKMSLTVFRMVCRGTRVEIYKSAQQDRELNSPAYLSQKLLAGAKKQAAGPARYALQTSALIQSDYPAGARHREPAGNR